jgi:hypothetical protein
MGLSFQHLLPHADEGEDELNRIFIRTGNESLPTGIKERFNAMETSQFIFNQKV